MKRTKRIKPVTLVEARARVPGLTQYKLEAMSGVDRTRISKLEIAAQGVMHDTYENLDAALRKAGALKPHEKLVFGPSPTENNPAAREAVAS